MDEIIALLKESLKDEFMSRPERKTVEAALQRRTLDQQQMNILRTKIFALANEKVNDKNFRFIVDWIKDVSTIFANHPIYNQGKSETFFSPGEACRNAIVKQMNDAKKQLKICVFTISDDAITESILRAHKRGVSVMVITDNDKSFDLGSDIDHMAKAGITVKMDQTTDHMHHKFMIADGSTVLTGSYNWTRSAAQYNHENILLTKEEEVVKSFLAEFEFLWKVMADYR